MTFNSKSVIMNKGVTHRQSVKTPSVFSKYKFAPDVIRKAVEEFNKKLDKRPHVTMHVKGIKADVLRIVPTSDETMALWLTVKENDLDLMNKVCFTIKGDVYFEGNSDEKVDHMVIHDVMFDDDHGIFADKKSKK